MNALPSDTRQRLLDAAVQVFRRQGYCATTVDDLCAQAQVTKGGFFHHFKGKEAFALAAIDHWNQTTGALFAHAPYQSITDPRERLFAYLDFRAGLLDRDVSEFTCLLGTLAQETFHSHPDIGRACGEGIGGHARTIAGILAQAKARYAPQAPWDPDSLAWHTQACLQGAFVLAKAGGGAAAVRDCLAHLRRYLIALLGDPSTPRASRAATSPRTRTPRSPR